MIAHFEQFVKRAESALEKFFSEGFNATKTYLIGANIVLVIFAVWFSNVGLLPFKNIGDFAFFALLVLILGLYRPGWTFLFFVGTLALENINIAPESLAVALRPYQFFGFITIIALMVQFFSKRMAFSLPKFRWHDALVVLFVVGGFLSALGAVDKGTSFKQSLIALSFAGLYFLVRIYIQSFEDLKRTMPFFLNSGLIVSAYAIWQNVRFLNGKDSFEVMPGRPNATFTEADWLGMYLVFLLAVLFAMLYELIKKSSVISHQSSNQQIAKMDPMTDDRLLMTQDNIRRALLYVFLVLIFTTLILTVSRSAWIGAVVAVVVFLKFVLLVKLAETGNGAKNNWQKFLEMFKLNLWQWRNAGIQFLFVAVAFGGGLLISMPLTRFEIANRAVSTGGLQKITIACTTGAVDVPVEIRNVSELAQYGCRHIDLEEIEKEKNAGSVVLEVSRPDPNVNIRAEIYKKAIAEIKAHPILGIGWGSIGAILGNDERGAGLNASNIFLEVWLGSGLLGFLSLVILLGYILIASIWKFIGGSGKIVPIVFVIIGWTAIVFPNLFNSGIFLGFIWAYLGIAVSLLGERK